MCVLDLFEGVDAVNCVDQFAMAPSFDLAHQKVGGMAAEKSFNERSAGSGSLIRDPRWELSFGRCTIYSRGNSAEMWFSGVRKTTN